jgi:TonB family protein
MEKSHTPVGNARLALVDDSGHVAARVSSDSSSGVFYLDAAKPGRYAVRIIVGHGGLSQSPFFALDSNQVVERTFAVPEFPREVLDAYLAEDVSKRVAPMPDQPRPRYPDQMRSQGRPGVVRARFVVAPDGRPNMTTYQTLEADDPSFSEAVRTAVNRARYYPAERDGSKVSQVYETVVDFGFGNDPPRVAGGDNLLVVRALGSTRRVAP